MNAIWKWTVLYGLFDFYHKNLALWPSPCFLLIMAVANDKWGEPLTSWLIGGTKPWPPPIWKWFCQNSVWPGSYITFNYTFLMFQVQTVAYICQWYQFVAGDGYAVCFAWSSSTSNMRSLYVSIKHTWRVSIIFCSTGLIFIQPSVLKFSLFMSG